MKTNVLDYINDAWLVVGLYWLYGAFRVKTTARRESWLSSGVHLAAIVCAYLLLCHPGTRIGLLGSRWRPVEPVLDWLGFALVIAGAALATWARTILGANWSSSVTVKQSHELVQRGPYTVVRHPIYTGLLLGILGTALAQGEVRGLIALAIAFASWSLKAGKEEQFMAGQFGDRYARYRQSVKKLIPFVY